MDKPTHPKHPGIGTSTSLIRLESDELEVGGFIAFFPSGRHLNVTWQNARPIEPTLDAAKQYAAKLIEELKARGLDSDIDRTNWASVTAAIQRVILDWNDRIKGAINIKMADAFGGEAKRLRRMH